MAGHIESGGSLEWNSPHWVREGALYVFNGRIELDPCSNATSVMGAKTNYVLPEKDGLVDPWNICGADTTVFVNSPFGRTFMTADKTSIIGQKEFERIGKEEPARAELYTVRKNIKDWVSRATTEWEFNGVSTLMILPAATDTAHWQNLIIQTASAVCFIRGRVRFLLPNGQPGGPAPMACALVLWGYEATVTRFDEVFSKKGRVIKLRQLDSWPPNVCKACHMVDCDVCHEHSEPRGDCSGCGDVL